MDWLHGQDGLLDKILRENWNWQIHCNSWKSILYLYYTQKIDTAIEKKVSISMRNAKMYKICRLHWLIFSHFTTFHKYSSAFGIVFNAVVMIFVVLNNFFEPNAKILQRQSSLHSKLSRAKYNILSITNWDWLIWWTKCIVCTNVCMKFSFNTHAGTCAPWFKIF